MVSSMEKMNTTNMTTTMSATTAQHRYSTSIIANHTNTDSTPFMTTPLQTSATSGNSSEENKCLWILYEDIGSSRIRIWDVMFFVPNFIFLVFVFYRLRRVWHRILSGIGSGGSPIFVTYFMLVGVSAVLGVTRGVVSMTVDVTSPSGNDANKILWVILRFFLLMAEMSVLVFGIAFGHLDSKTSIKRVLFVTTCVALVYSIIQCVLELVVEDPRFKYEQVDLTVYGHGGTLFSFISSLIFLCMYVTVSILPFLTWLQKYLSVPTRRSFYVYVIFMAFLNFIAAIGGGLLLYWKLFGLCLLDAFSIAYFTLFGPLVYWTFLSSYFGNTQPTNMLFSYSTHVDEGLTDVADFDMPNNGITVDSTLSGILVFDDGNNESYQISNGHIEEPLREFTNTSTDDISPSTDSTHSFIRGHH